MAGFMWPPLTGPRAWAMVPMAGVQGQRDLQDAGHCRRPLEGRAEAEEDEDEGGQELCEHRLEEGCGAHLLHGGREAAAPQGSPSLGGGGAGGGGWLGGAAQSRVPAAWLATWHGPAGARYIPGRRLRGGAGLGQGGSRAWGPAPRARRALVAAALPGPARPRPAAARPLGHVTRPAV